MARTSPVALPTRTVVYVLVIFGAGLGLAMFAVAALATSPRSWSGLDLLAIPVIVVIARFPIVLDRGDGGIEVGFDSLVLVFLLCTLPAQEALVLWFLGVLASQLAVDKRGLYSCFNIGVGMIGAAAAALVITQLRGPAVSTAVLAGVRGDAFGTPRELAAVGFGALAYFACDYVLTAVAVSLESSARLRAQLLQRGTLVAIACFVPFDSLGYLGAVVTRTTPWWTLGLLAVPLAVLIVATRAVTRGSENARRLSVLFEAAVRAQTLSDSRQVVDALVDDARRLLRISDVRGPDRPRRAARDRRPAARRSARPVDRRPRPAPGPSTANGDRQALEALVAVASDAFARLRLTDDMTHLARHDLLTNLPNRGLLLDRVGHALQLARRRAPASPCCSSTSTGSSRSTTASATRPATRCSSTWPSASPGACARATPWPGWVATSSRYCSRTCSPGRRHSVRTHPRRAVARGARGRAPPVTQRQHRCRLRRPHARPPRACCATRTWRCTRPSPAARTSSCPTSARSADRACNDSSSSSRCAPPWPPATCRWSTSRWCALPRVGSPASRRSRGGGPTASTCPRTSSSGWPRRAGWWSRSATWSSSRRRRPPAGAPARRRAAISTSGSTSRPSSCASPTSSARSSVRGHGWPAPG